MILLKTDSAHPGLLTFASLPVSLQTQDAPGPYLPPAARPRPGMFWSASAAPPSVSAMGAAVAPQGPRTCGPSAQPGHAALCCALEQPPGGSLERVSTAGLCGGGPFGRKLLARQRAGTALHSEQSAANACCTWLKASKISMAT